MTAQQKHLVLGVTGSVAAYKAADLIRRLKEKQVRVSVIMTHEAEAFITPLTLSSLSGEPVSPHMFQNSVMDSQMRHIQLAQEAKLILVAPATANIIAKFAAGLADDLLTCTVLATRAPVLIAPAMNDQMYENPVVKENCRRLREFGFRFVEPVVGELACGRYGQGHIADIDQIVDEVLKFI